MVYAVSKTGTGKDKCRRPAIDGTPACHPGNLNRISIIGLPPFATGEGQDSKASKMEKPGWILQIPVS